MFELIGVEVKDNKYHVTYKTSEVSQVTYIYTKDAFVRMANLFKQSLKINK